MEFLCTIKGGVLTPLFSKEKLWDKIMRDHEGKNIKVTLQPTVKNVNTAQIQLYKAMIMSVVEQTGSDYKEVQDLLYDKCGEKDMDMINGNPCWVTKKVEEMNVTEFNRFVEKSRIFINEFFNVKF